MILSPPIMLAGAPPDVVFRGAGSKRAFAGSGSTSVGWHANAQIGDFALLLAQTDQGDSVDPTPSGWTYWETEDTGECRLHLFAREITSLSNFTVANTGDHLICATLAFGNVDLANPFDNSQISSTGGTLSTSVVIPNPNTLFDRSFVVSVVGHDIASDSSCVAFSANASLESSAELVDYSTSSGWDGGFAALGGIKASPGAVNNTTGTLSVGKRKAYIGFALRRAN